MTHTSQVIKSGITLFSSSIFINIFLIGFGIYFAHVLPKKEMAVFAVYGLLAGIVNILAWLGMNDTIFKNVPELVAKKNIKKASSLTKYALCVKISVVFLLSLLLFIFAKQVSVVFLKTETFSSLMRLVSVAVFMEAVSRTFDPVARSLQIFNKFAMIKIVKNLVGRVCAIILFFIIGFKGFIMGFIAGSFIELILYIYFTRELVINKIPIKKQKGIIKYSLPYFASGLSRYTLVHIDQYLVAIFLLPETLALYYIAKKIISYIEMLVESTMTPLAPKLAELKVQGIERISTVFKKTSRYVSFAFIPICFFVASISYPFLFLYGGIKYVSGFMVLSILSFSMVNYAFTSLYGSYVFIAGEPKIKFKMNFMGGILNLILGIILIYSLNIVGIAISRFLAFLGTIFIGHFLLKKILKFEFDKKALLVTTMISCLMFLIIVIPQIAYYRLYLVPVYVIIGSLVFLMLFIRILKKEDFILIKDIIPKRFIPLFDFIIKILLCKKCI